jgi:hypothetical protein
MPHNWTPDETKNRCTICGDGPWGRHRFQEPPPARLGGICKRCLPNDDGVSRNPDCQACHGTGFEDA